MEKVELTPPDYTEFSSNKPSMSTSKMALVTYSAVVTTFFVAALLFGGIYYSTHLSHCTQNSGATMTAKYQTHEETIRVDGQDIRQQVSQDPDRQVEVIRYKNDSDSNGIVVVLDYARSLTAMYVPAARECFLIGGIDRHITTPFSGQQVADEAGSDEENINYVKAEDYPVVNHSMLPEDLQDTCQDLQVFWMERTTDTDTDSRLVKRGFCGYACYYRNGVRVCVRYCN